MGGINQYTSLMLHADGADGSKKFIDSSPNGYVPTSGGDVQIDTAESKFGGGAILFDGTGDTLYYAKNDSWQFANEDFTIDWQMYQRSTGYQTIFSTYKVSGGTNTGIYLVNLNGDTQFQFVMYDTVGALVANHYFPHATTTAGWTHIALVKSGTAMKLFQDGILATEQTNVTATIITVTSEGLTLGASRGGANYLYWYSGWIDEFRIVNGSAMFTENFTPPTSAYTVGINSGIQGLNFPLRPGDL